MFTLIRLVDTGVESLQYLQRRARIRGYYRTLGPDAAVQFTPETGRWPETRLRASVSGNKIVAGVTLLANTPLGQEHRWLALTFGIAAAVLLSAAFILYQHWRFRAFETPCNTRLAGGSSQECRQGVMPGPPVSVTSPHGGPAGD